MPKARIAVLGAGWWGAEVYIPSLLANPAAALTAVNRRNPEALRQITEKFGIPAGYTDYRELLAKEPLVGAIIVSPHTVHFEQAMADHIDGTPAIRQLTSRALANVEVTECWRGPCTVELRPNAQAPVHRLPVKEMLDGFYWRARFTLVPGIVIHDYLKEGA